MRSERIGLAVLGLALLGLGGCPGVPGDSIQPVVSVSATRGPAPLRISVSGAASTSQQPLASARWDFGGDGTASGLTAQHTFEDPGRYLVRLTLTDVDGNSASAGQIVRVAGDPIQIVISASRTSGTAPAGITFDAKKSELGGDQLYDFRWDFGDGSTSNETEPFHRYPRGGTYEVTLRATTGGGVSGEGRITIVLTGGAPDPNDDDPNEDDPNDDDPNDDDPNDDDPNDDGDPNDDDPNDDGDPNDDDPNP